MMGTGRKILHKRERIPVIIFTGWDKDDNWNRIFFLFNLSPICVGNHKDIAVGYIAWHIKKPWLDVTGQIVVDGRPEWWQAKRLAVLWIA